jgi:uncharacterized membrane protein
MATTNEVLTARQQVDSQHKHPVNRLIHDEATLGERVADKASTGIGSWTFLIVQSILIVIWVALNVIGLINHWDPYPFILLNLCFTIQAAYTGPILLLAGNRQAQKDRLRLEHTAEVAETAEKSTLDILAEIERNTEATLKILEHLQKRREQKGGSSS